MTGSKNEELDDSVFVNPLMDSPNGAAHAVQVPSGNSTAQAAPPAPTNSPHHTIPNITVEAIALPQMTQIASPCSRPPEPSKDAGKPAATPSEGEQAPITRHLDAPAVTYLQSPRLLGHGELFLDRVFTQSDWDAHISFRRYLPEPVVMFKVVVALMYPIIMVLFVTAACAIYEELIRKSRWYSLSDLDANFAYSLCSFALSLLLIFKTNTSYARFWEARTQWGAVYTDCRAFILKVQSQAPDTPVHVRRALVRWTIALPYTMRCHLMDYKPGSEMLHKLLTETEVEWLRKAPWSFNRHQPIRAVGVLLALLQHTRAHPIHVAQLSEHLRDFLGRCGSCERIRATPIPMPYTRHTTRFILFYTFFMPFVLWRNLRWGVFFVAPLITLLLAGIDNIGIFIENPINILPMSSYCRVIHDNVILAAHDWSLGNCNDAAALVSKSLQETAPLWQHEGQAHALTDCAGTLKDTSAFAQSPAIYRRGTGTATADFDVEGDHSRRGRASDVQIEQTTSGLSGRLSSTFRRHRESSTGASGRESGLSFRSQNESRVFV